MTSIDTLLTERQDDVMFLAVDGSNCRCGERFLLWQCGRKLVLFQKLVPTSSTASFVAFDEERHLWLPIENKHLLHKYKYYLGSDARLLYQCLGREEPSTQ
jgi:hypothetical protein